MHHCPQDDSSTLLLLLDPSLVLLPCAKSVPYCPIGDCSPWTIGIDPEEKTRLYYCRYTAYPIPNETAVMLCLSVFLTETHRERGERQRETNKAIGSNHKSIGSRQVYNYGLKLTVTIPIWKCRAHTTTVINMSRSRLCRLPNSDKQEVDGKCRMRIEKQ